MKKIVMAVVMTLGVFFSQAVLTVDYTGSDGLTSVGSTKGGGGTCKPR